MKKWILAVYIGFMGLASPPSHAQADSLHWDKELLSELSDYLAFTTEKGLLVRLGGTRAYRKGSAVLTRRAHKKVKRLAIILSRYPYLKIHVQGHMDQREEALYPRKLSYKRARHIRKVLIRFGVSPNRIFTVGYGNSRPIISLDVPRNSALNRRVDILISVSADLTQSPHPENVLQAVEAEPAPVPIEPAAQAVEKHQWLQLSGYIKNETAKRTGGSKEFTKSRNLLSLTSTGRFIEGMSYKISGRLFYDAIYDLDNRYPVAVKEDRRFETALRDAYFDISADNWDFRLGKQQIVWGEAFGLFFADIVNAKDLREFMLPDFEYIRIPQWAAEIQYTGSNTHAELVWQPILEFNKFGLPGSEFAFPLPLLPGRRPQALSTKEPPNTLRNSEIGGRLSNYIEGWDTSVFSFYGWDKTPTLYRSLSPSSLTFSPEHKRLHLSGITITKEIKNVVLTGEGVYSRDKNFSVLNASSIDGVVQKDLADYVLGLTTTLWGRLNLNLQMMERRIFGYESDIFHESHARTLFSLWLKTDLWSESFEPEIIITSNMRKNDKLIQPRLNYKMGNNWRARLRADLFMGQADGLFGQFADRDRVQLELTYDF